MERADQGLAFMLRYENVAWYENGAVRILDRRIYPERVEFVVCHRHEEVAQAIRDMVTQSAGPYLAAGMGMALAAKECQGKHEAQQLEYLKRAADTLSHARPTTALRMERITHKCFEAASTALAQGRAADEAVFQHTLHEINAKYERIGRVAEYLVQKFPNQGTILTQCFGETIVGQMLKATRRADKQIKVICAETRPYFQGARLTASVALDQGFDVTVITDNMPAWAMKNNMVDLFTSAADAITCDGYVVNKVGTFQIAILCQYFGLPYYTTGIPDQGHLTVDSVHIEMRDSEQVLEAMGVRTAKQGVNGYYPAFDVTPPELIHGIVTDKGIFAPEQVSAYFDA